MAELDRSYYRGSDAYTDGDEAENRLLDLARSHTGLDELETGDVSWPVLYHMHPARENVCNWYPFRRDARILEIGSGCGAITGALCKTGCRVVSVELSLRRATINYERHRDCENLHIIVGNLNDIAFDEPFDYVLLIGVLEYAGRFTDGQDPYRTFLENIRRYLKPEGRLLVAIENRLGLKYFSGAPEDHMGRTFAGLKGYDPADGVRTFSRSELQNLLERSGFVDSRFYYPYPDYKFANEVFSDETLSTMHYGKYFCPVDEVRNALFPEQTVAELLAREGSAASVANSFFVEAAQTPIADAERVVYVKQNSERDPAFQIATKIISDSEGRLRVLKYAMTDAARAHLVAILDNERTLGAFENVLRGEMTDEGIAYPYLREKTVDTLLSEALRRERGEEALELIDGVLQLASLKAEEAEYRTEAFRAWFGDARPAWDRAVCACPANVDLILDNIFVRENGFELVDCEWVTNFPVPVRFILWRALQNAYYQYAQLEELVPREDMFGRYDIRAEDIGVFKTWSQHFEAEYVKNNGLARFGKGIRLVEHDQAKIDAYDQTVAGLESQLSLLSDTMALDKRHIQNLEGIVAAREADLENMRQTTALDKRHIQNLEGIVAAREADLENMRQTTALDKQHIHNLEGINEELNARLEEIYNTPVWKLAAKLKRLGSALRRYRGGTKS